MNNFAVNIQLLRKILRLKQSEISATIGFNRPAWGNYETGASVPTLKDALRIAKYFGITLTQLVEDDLSKNVALMEKLGKEKISTETSSKQSPIGSPNYDNKHDHLVLNDREIPYLLSKNVVEQRLQEKDDIIAAQKGQIEALKLAVTQLEYRLEPKK